MESNIKKKTLLTTVGLLLAYFPTYTPSALGNIDESLKPSGPTSVIYWNWIAVIALLVFILIIERKLLSSILLIKPNKKDILWALIFWAVAMTWNVVANTIAPQPTNTGIETLSKLSLPWLFALVFTTAITEEILYRGYSIERIRELTGKLWLAVLFSFIIFLLPHISFFGYQWLFYQGIGTILIYILYIWRRNLYACMLLHFLLNVPVLFIS
ncbi:CPBP family intramembrane glutamic endopeptidase [Cytophagaceae bacterium ABcell3]|nr:CPBP family intramembrane glutamic endopeptidase [Cytophagaceae bacterium ABcell3]